MSSILVTGALGNVGRYVVQEAIKANLTVKAGGPSIERIRNTFGSQAEGVYFDFTKPETFTQALEGVEMVFLMRPPHLGKPKDLEPFIEVLSKHKHLRLVCFLSLQGIEKNPMPPHYKIEKMLEAKGLPYCHIRPSFFMQNLSGVHAFEIKYFDQIYIPVGKAKTSFIDAEDIAETIIQIFKQPEAHCEKAYTLTGPQALSYETVAQLMSQALGRKISYGRPSFISAYHYWVNIRQLDKAYARVMIMLYGMTYLGTASQVQLDIETLIGRPATTVAQFISKHKGLWMPT